MSETLIQTENLTKRFRKMTAVGDLSIQVEEGSVFGLIGRNGAGKTTTIKMLLGLLPPTSGSATVLGMASGKEGLRIRRDVGYVPEQHHMYRWMTVDELMWFVKPFYPTWDDDECSALLKRFDLPRKAKIRELSRGMVAKVALTMALAHRPKILVLDEATGGLDVIVRREFLESIVHMLEDRGGTVFISSHLLADVERVVDHVAIVDEGKLVTQESVDSLKGRVKQLRLRFDGLVPDEVAVDGLLRTTRDEHEWVVSVSDFADEMPAALKQETGAADVEVVHLSLEDIFVELVGRSSDPAEKAAA